jgi:predicted ribosomally synthesized peptide with SipW-like signal peptide
MSNKHARLGRFLASARTRAALSLGLVLVVGSTGTFAYWTDDVTVKGTTFTAGTLDLQVNDLNSVAAYTALNLDKMVPGNSMAGTLVIKNNGNVPLKYTAAAVAVNADSTKNLGGSLTAKVTSGGTTGSSPMITCTGATVAGSGTTVNGSLISTGRQLAPGATETICVEVTLPANASNSLQGARTDVTFTFTGTSDLS